MGFFFLLYEYIALIQFKLEKKKKSRRRKTKQQTNTNQNNNKNPSIQEPEPLRASYCFELGHAISDEETGDNSSLNGKLESDCSDMFKYAVFCFLFLRKQNTVTNACPQISEMELLFECVLTF